MLAQYPLRDREHFEDEIDARAGTYACVYDTTNKKTLLEYGNPHIKSDLFSVTKSLTSLVILHDMSNTRSDELNMDIGRLMGVFYFKRNRDANNPPPPPGTFKGLTLAMLMNHVAGIDEIPLNASSVVDLIVGEKNLQNIVGRYLGKYKKNSPFKYSPILGYAIVGCIYELLRNRGKYIKERFSEVFVRDVWDEFTWDWRTDDGKDICEHTLTFSEVHTTGENMLKLGISLLQNHRDLVEYILDDEKPYPCYIKDANHAGASSYGRRHGTAMAATKSHYDYSMGWWILRYSSSRRYIIAIGWLGQYLIVGPDDGIVAVRQHAFGQPVRDLRVRHENSLKTATFIPNHHEHFPIHVMAFLDLVNSKGGCQEEINKTQ